MPRLIAIDFAASAQFRNAVQHIWHDGDVVLALDQRLLPAARHRVAVALGADLLVDEHGTHHLPIESVATSSSATPLVALQPDDALVIATSGSTGAPKGVVHTHTGLAAHARMTGERLGLSSTDHWWLCLPPAHIGGFGVLYRALHFGVQLSFAAHVDEGSLQAALAAGATHTAVVPTHLVRHDFAQWQAVLVGGARSGVLPSNAISTYGLTETGGGVVYDGVALNGVAMQLIAGRILLQSPTMARTYRHTALPLQDGWLDTGDVGVMVDGRLRVQGRADDLIITGGNKVWPHVVEQRLREHPLVRDVAVRGRPDPEWGSIVCAYVAPVSPTNAPTLEALRNHVKETLAAYYAPRELVVVDSIPRTALGKVVTAELPQ